MSPMELMTKSSELAQMVKEGTADDLLTTLQSDQISLAAREAALNELFGRGHNLGGAGTN